MFYWCAIKGWCGWRGVLQLSQILLPHSEQTVLRLDYLDVMKFLQGEWLSTFNREMITGLVTWVAAYFKAQASAFVNSPIGSNTSLLGWCQRSWCFGVTNIAATIACKNEVQRGHFLSASGLLQDILATQCLELVLHICRYMKCEITYGQALRLY